MLRSVAFAALVLSLALDVAAHSGTKAAADSGTQATVVNESSVLLVPTNDYRTLSEPSVLLLVGFALITVSRAARR
jgi:hypothetical protein